MAFAAPLIAAAPAFLGSAGGIAALGSGALGAVTAISQGNYQAAVAKNNARIAEGNAEREALSAQQEAARSDREYAALAASQLMEQAASGLSIGSRSSIAARTLTRRVGNEAARDLVTGGSDAAQRLKQDAANFRAEAKNARTQGYLSAAGAAMGTVAKVSEGIESRSMVSRRPARRFRELY